MHRLLLFLVLLTSAPVARGGAREFEPMKLKRLPVVTGEKTERAAKLLQELPGMTLSVAAEQLAELLDGHELPKDEAGPWLELISRVGGPAELQRVYVGLITALADDCCEGSRGADFDRRLAFTTDDMVRTAAKALIDAAETRHVVPTSPYLDGRLHFGRHVYFVCPDGLEGDLARLAALYRVTEDYDSVVSLLDRPEYHRGAFEALLLLEPDATAAAVEGTCQELDNPLAARGALILLARTSPERALVNAARVLSMPMENEALADLWKQLLAAEEFREALLRAVPPYLPPHVLAAGEYAARGAGALELADEFHRRTAHAVADFAPLAEDARRHGNAAHGELLFRGDAGLCSECHALGGVGPTRGPDLARLAALRAPDAIVSAVLQPSAHVTRQYEMLVSDETEETAFPGTAEPVTAHKFKRRPRAEGEAAAKRRDAAGPGAISGMPTGLTDDFTLQELRDLLAFLLQLGAPGGLDAANPHVARQWRMEEETSTHPGDFINRRQPTGGTSEVTSLIDGRLRREDCLAYQNESRGLQRFYVGTYFNVPIAGKVRLTFTGVAHAWVDGQPISDPGAAEVPLDLTAGEHRVDLRIDPKEMPRFLRVSSPEARFSTRALYQKED